MDVLLYATICTTVLLGLVGCYFAFHFVCSWVSGEPAHRLAMLFCAVLLALAAIERLAPVHGLQQTVEL